MQNSLQAQSANTNNDTIDINKLKEYFQSKGGRLKYSELFNTFRDFIGNDPNLDEQFHELLNTIANKKIDSDTNEEWWTLKKKYLDSNMNSNTATNFIFNTFQKTKHNLSKFESRLTNAFNKENNQSNNLKNAKHQQIQQQPQQQPQQIQQQNDEYNNNNSFIPSVKVDQVKATEPILQPVNKDTINDDEQQNSSNVKSVKEHAKKLNRLNTESELVNYKRHVSSSYVFKDQNKLHSSMNKLIEIEPLDLSSINTKPYEKEWIIVCSQPDSYMDVARLLSKHPYLAQKKDPFNTCAHWACKHGNVEIIKLLASTLENDKTTNPKSIRINHLINSRTGYTCLHIAYIYGNSSNTTPLIQMLVQYGAQSIPDFNGKLGMDYAVGSHDFHVKDTNDRKSSLLDFTNDANAITKRNSAMILQKEKEKRMTFGSDITNLENEGFNESNINKINVSKSYHSTPNASPLLTSRPISIQSLDTI